MMNIMVKFNKFIMLRNIEKMNDTNKGNRSLYESVFSQEVLSALTDWERYYIENEGVLIGGLALSFYVKPRMTFDIDVLFLHKKYIPSEVTRFKKHRTGAFQHNITHVEVEVLSPETINTEQHIVDTIFKTSVEIDGFRIASPNGIIALKLGRFSYQDRADIFALKSYLKENNEEVNLSIFNLSDELLKRFETIE
jgi:hypothetical protein